MGLFSGVTNFLSSTAGKILGGVNLGSISGMLFGVDKTAEALKQQQELMLQQQQAQLNSMRQQNLLDAANASSNIANVVTGDTLTVAETIKKRKQGNSISSSLGL